MPDTTLIVTEIKEICADVRQFVLTPPASGSPLRSYVPGSHIAVQAGPYVNTYSLTDDGYRPDAYRISVRRLGRGGGSDWMHDHSQTGDTLTVSPPRSMFPPVMNATNHLLIGAGIGITPILSHLKAARRWNHPFNVIYGAPTSRAPHLDDVRSIGRDDVTVVDGRDMLIETVRTALSRQPVGTHAYACGPGTFLESFIRMGTDLGWPESRLHVEHFQAPLQDAGHPFQVKLAIDGRRLDVPSGISLLAVLDHAGVELPRLCRRGVCGRCEVQVLAGVPDHRDLIQSQGERDRNDRMYACVSRAVSAELELDL